MGAAKPVKRWLRRLSWTALVLILTVNILAYRHARSFFFFTEGGARTPPPEALSWGQKIAILVCGVRIPKPEAHTSPNTVGLPFEEIFIPGREKMMLSAWLIPRPDAKSTVLMFHGYGSEKSGLIPEARLLWDMDYEIVMVDFPGSGRSPGNMTSLGILEAEDVAGVIGWARQQWPQRQLIVYGHSMGGAAIMRAMAINDAQPDAAVVESVFDNLLQAIRFRFELLSVPSFPAAEILLFWGSLQLRSNGYEHDVVRYAQSIRTPVLMIHGANDRRAPVDAAWRVYDNLSGTRQFLLLEHAGHVNPCIANPKKWRETVRVFIEQQLDP